MGDLTRAAIAERIAQDDGAADDRVHLTKRRGNRARYHDDADCHHIQQGRTYRELPRREAKRRGRPPCAHCVLESVERHTEQRRSLLNIVRSEEIETADEDERTTLPRSVESRNKTFGDSAAFERRNNDREREGERE